MKIKIVGMPMAYSDETPVEAAKRVAKDFGIMVDITAETGPGGWPEVSLIGTPHNIINALTAEGGWSCGDAEEDAEMVFHALRDAVEVYG